MHDHHLMGEALREAGRALAAGEFPVGCLLVQDGKVVARGHRLHSGPDQRNEIDHAEIVTLRSLLREQPQTDPAVLTLYSTMEPCLMCYTTLLLSGIRRFVWGYEDVMGGGTSLDLASLPSLWSAMVVDLKGSVRRAECLVLFQRFFQQHDYWQDSLLARYTLRQPLSGEEV